jgi:acetyl-CoA carboxylase biotin carboxyl carrier protein
MATDVKSEMTGTVWQIEVAEGDEVAAGDELIILESMKMEIPIEAPVSGTLIEFLVEEDDPVDEDQIVARIEE